MMAEIVLAQVVMVEMTEETNLLFPSPSSYLDYARSLSPLVRS